MSDLSTPEGAPGAESPVAMAVQPSTPGDVAIVGRQTVNLRRWMSTIAPVKRPLRPGTRVTLLSEPVHADGHIWVKVRLADTGETGYAVAQYLELVERGTPQSQVKSATAAQPDADMRYETGDLLVTSSWVNLRSGPGLDHPIEMALDRNGLGIVLDEPTEVDSVAWVPVRFPEGSGWIAAQSTTMLSRTGKWLEADLSTQTLTAWETSTKVASSPISSGMPGFETPTGLFSILFKIPTRRLRGNTRGETWDIPGVPWILVFRTGGFYIHAVYWHEDFGTPVSHGCITLPIDFAEWLYEFTPLGTRFWVHY